MKKQRNTQQVKEQDKCPPNQTEEEEIRNLPDKEFQIMIVKMIQNLENKMETLINRMVAHIKKYKKSLTRCLEESFHFHLRFKGFVNKISHSLYTNNTNIRELSSLLSIY